MLGLLLVYKIPYSCIFNTAIVLEPGTMVCVYHTAVHLVHRSCLCHMYSWFLPMSWILDLSILLSICRAYMYICSAGYAKLPVLLYLLQCLVYQMLSKTRTSSGSLHRVIGEVLVLGLLVVYKMPYSSCMFNTVLVEPGKMLLVCAHQTGRCDLSKSDGYVCRLGATGRTIRLATECQDLCCVCVFACMAFPLPFLPFLLSFIPSRAWSNR